MSNNLEKLRKQQGLTLVEMAAKMGVSTYTLVRWEKGVHKPHRNNWVRLNECYRSSIEQAHYEGVDEDTGQGSKFGRPKTGGRLPSSKHVLRVYDSTGESYTNVRIKCVGGNAKYKYYEVV